MLPSEPAGNTPEPGAPEPGAPGPGWAPAPPGVGFPPPGPGFAPPGPGFAGSPFPPPGGGPPTQDAYPPGAYPPGVYPPPGGGYRPPSGPVAQPKKRRGWLIALFVVLGVMVLGVGGCVAAAALGVRALTAPADAANRWLDELEGGIRSDALDELTCPAFRPELDRLQDVLSRRGWDGGQDLTSTNIVNGEATVAGTLDLRRTTTDVSVYLERTDEGGHQGWCVRNLALDL